MGSPFAIGHPARPARGFRKFRPRGPRNQKGGESGFRSRCLVVANDALYRLSYSPTEA